MNVTDQKCIAGALGVSIAFLHHPISRITDRLAARSGDVSRGMLAAIKITDCPVGVVSRPGIIHADRQAEEIARLRRWMGCIDADRGQYLLVPGARDARRGMGGIIDQEHGKNSQSGARKSLHFDFFERSRLGCKVNEKRLIP